MSLGWGHVTMFVVGACGPVLFRLSGLGSLWTVSWVAAGFPSSCGLGMAILLLTCNCQRIMLNALEMRCSSYEQFMEILAPPLPSHTLLVFFSRAQKNVVFPFRRHS
eukprot:scaffold8252_cov226-Amphora_coffeaeformis.AAC.2